jgi:hypothetical protein
MKKLNIYLCLFAEKGYAFDLWYQNLGMPLEQMGHQVFLPQGIPLLAALHHANCQMWNKAQREDLSNKILQDFKRQLATNKKIDLFLAYLYPKQFSPHLFTEIEKLGIPVVYFFCDNFAFKDSVAGQYAKYATLNWVPEIEAIPFFEASKSKYIWLPMAANPQICLPLEKEETVDVSFAGTKNPYRRDLLSILLHQEFSFKVYGQGWAESNAPSHLPFKEEISDTWWFKTQSKLKFKWQGIVYRLRYPHFKKNSAIWSNLGAEYDMDFQKIASHTHHELADIYAHSAVSIGINDQVNMVFKNPLVIYSKLRDFEATMSGACLLTQATPEQPHLFEIGSSIETYRTKSELLEKTIYLLRNPTKRKEMRKKARETALALHRWENRYEKLFQHLY